MKKIAAVILLTFLVGCAQVTSLGLKKHQFGVQPSKIIWIQYAGLHEEQLAMLKFSLPLASSQLTLERATCVGKIWNYNLYGIRHSSATGFHAQTTGSKNIQNSCQDYNLTPIWKYFQKSGYETNFVEMNAEKNQSSVVNSCLEKDLFYQDVTRFVASAAIESKGNLFHVSESQLPYNVGELYYDRSCTAKGCFTSMNENMHSILERIAKNKNFYSYIVRDFAYEKALRQKNFKKAKELLFELEKFVTQLVSTVNLNDTLILISSTAPVGVEMPKSTQEWKKFEQDGSGAAMRADHLLSNVFAFGARAENFCGVYEEFELLPRILSGPKQQGLEFTIVNPFQ
jgi:hypothetical protein